MRDIGQQAAYNPETFADLQKMIPGHYFGFNQTDPYGGKDYSTLFQQLLQAGLIPKGVNATTTAPPGMRIIGNPNDPNYAPITQGSQIGGPGALGYNPSSPSAGSGGQPSGQPGAQGSQQGAGINHPMIRALMARNGGGGGGAGASGPVSANFLQNTNGSDMMSQLQRMYPFLSRSFV